MLRASLSGMSGCSCQHCERNVFSRGDPQFERSSCFVIFEYTKRVFHLNVLISWHLIHYSLPMINGLLRLIWSRAGFSVWNNATSDNAVTSTFSLSQCGVLSAREARAREDHVTRERAAIFYKHLSAPTTLEVHSCQTLSIIYCDLSWSLKACTPF